MYAVNRTRGTFLGVDIKRADRLAARMIGLYRHRNLSLGDGVWLVPCNGIQTVGMKATIDVVFLNRERRVVRVYENVRPGRVIFWVPRARSALEVPAGAVGSSETRVGDTIEFTDHLPEEDQSTPARRSPVLVGRS
jgi:uncharacterized membrane protein (UPF0127 family)